MSDARMALDEAIDAIEGGYEFLLAYAAQGRRSDREGSGSGPRQHLGQMRDALARLPDIVRQVAAAADPELTAGCSAYFEALGRDAATAEAAIRLVLAQTDIGSQLIDNLNASIHLRAVLTDVFLVDELFRKK